MDARIKHPRKHSIAVNDISLADYFQTRHAVYLPHTVGHYAKKQFKDAQMPIDAHPIVERLVDRCVSLFVPEVHLANAYAFS